ncbi:MAG: hypothetical protein ACRD34_00330 [Bryobacteraceae bacterium]
MVFVLAFVALVVYSSVHGARYRVKVCMVYQGRTSCRTVTAKRKQDALRGAVENACGDIASGVTETFACQQTPPKSVQWLHQPGH